MSRGARRQAVFLDDTCCVYFLSLVEDTVARFELVVSGYALMPNHFHLMVRTPLANLGESMKYLLSRYGYWLNKTHGWDGSVFRGRYKNRVVTDDAYWRHLLAYIHLNPVRAGLVMRPSRANWTSHGAYTGRDDRPAWLDVREMVSLFGSVEQLEKYVVDVHRGAAGPPPGFDPDDLFSRRRRDELEHPEGDSAGAPIHQRTPDEAIAEVTEVTGESLGELRVGRAGRSGHPARWLAMWWLVTAARLTGVETAKILDSDPATVARSIRRVRARAVGTSQMAEWVATLSELPGAGRGLKDQ